MGIGASVFLIAIGAILTFATDFDISGVDVDVVGVILMVAGAIGLLVTLVVWAPRRRSATSSRPALSTDARPATVVRSEVLNTSHWRPVVACDFATD